MAFRFPLVLIVLVVALLHVVVLGNFLLAKPTTKPITASSITAVLVPSPEVKSPELTISSEPSSTAQPKITPMQAPVAQREPVVRKPQVKPTSKLDVKPIVPKNIEVKPTTKSTTALQSLPIAPATEHSPVAKSEPVTKESSTVKEAAVKETTVKESPAKEVATKEIPPAPVAAVKTTLPQHRAGYLNNPPPRYPEASREEGEEGKVLVKVMVRADGSAGEVKLQKSSGFARLDRAALDAVKQWRFVPAKRGDEAIDMWYTVPIPFELN